jgi:hypothetical protein
LSFSKWNVCIIKDFNPHHVTLASLVLGVALKNGALDSPIDASNYSATAEGF